jgi:hypothetical protein
MMPEYGKCTSVCRHCVVVEVAANDVMQPLPLFGDRLVHAPVRIGEDSYFFSKKICLQSALPVFSAECEAMVGRALAVPALLSNSVVLPSAAYSFVLQSVKL